MQIVISHIKSDGTQSIVCGVANKNQFVAMLAPSLFYMYRSLSKILHCCADKTEDSNLSGIAYAVVHSLYV